MSDALPIDALRARFFQEEGPLVITAPTGSGKSTQLPRWAAEQGVVYVVEPRRVACRALAARVASLEGTALGEGVGYQVRGERRMGERTRIRFVTPGIALQQLGALEDATTVVLDELHERRLDVDLLLALLMTRRPRLVAMSATLDGARVAAHLGGTLLEASGRLFPVDITYRDEGAAAPSHRDLDVRVARALEDAKNTGDVLVFLPGKAEIAQVERALKGGADQVLALHGTMDLKSQNRVFAPSERRKIVLATNIAETSLTIPGISLVIDSGLVRRTEYHRGRAHLALSAIAQDAADQRAGRAGRTGPGACIRLWSRRTTLEAQTPPEIHRESLVPLVLAAAACGQSAASLPLLDAPKTHALDDAIRELQALGALDDAGEITGEGQELFGLPIDPALGRLLVEARREGGSTLAMAVDLVAALSSTRPIFRGEPTENDPFRFDACDASALVRAMRASDASGLEHVALREARELARRLDQAMGVSRDEELEVDGARLRDLALRADPRAAHVVRRRGKKQVRFALAGGATELQVARESAAWKALEPERGTKAATAMVVFDARAFGTGRERRLLATCCSPCERALLQKHRLGEPKLGRVWIEKKPEPHIRAVVQRVLAGEVLDEGEETPSGELARQALVVLLERGSLFQKALRESRSRLRRRALAAHFSHLAAARDYGLGTMDAPESFDVWLRNTVDQLGVESGEDLAMLSAADFECADVPFEIRDLLDSVYPPTVSLGDANYRVDFDLEKKQAILNMTKGKRDKPPPRSFLPKFPGLAVYVEAGRSLHRVR